VADSPDPVATADQIGASLESQASILGQFFRKLVAEGFERHEAQELVRDYFEWQLDRQGEDD
jgi:hypothetical protein